MNKTVKKLKIMKLNLKEAFFGKVFSKVPFEKANSYEFLKSIKMEKLHQCNKLLQNNKYLVYDFDDVHMTGLHWAAKMNNIRMCQLLLSHGADIASLDLIGRTPLYHAATNGNVQSVQLLLYHKADPWNSSVMNYDAIIPNAKDPNYANLVKIHGLIIESRKVII